MSQESLEDTQPLSPVIEKENTYLLVSFGPNMGEKEQNVMVRILSDDCELAIEKRLNLKPNELRDILSRMKKLVVAKGEIWPNDKTALIYALQTVGEMKVKRVPK